MVTTFTFGRDGVVALPTPMPTGNSANAPLMRGSKY